jgi:hypothetical protein
MLLRSTRKVLNNTTFNLFGRERKKQPPCIKATTVTKAKIAQSLYVVQQISVQFNFREIGLGKRVP